MNTHKAFILGVALLSTIGVKAQFAIDNYKAVFTSSPQHVPTTKTPDAPLAGNGDIGIVWVTVYHDIILINSVFILVKMIFGGLILFIREVLRFRADWILR